MLFTSDSKVFWRYSKRTTFDGSCKNSTRLEEIHIPQALSWNFQSILGKGLLPGGKEKDKARQAVFLTPTSPFADDPEEEEPHDDFRVPRKASMFRNGSMTRTQFAGYDCQRRRIKDWNSGKTDNFAPLSVNSESSSSCTTPSPESLGPEASFASGSRVAASSSSDSVFGRSDETSSGKLGQESWESDKKDENDPLADMPFWLEDFTDNLIPTEVQACTSTHFSGFGFGRFYESGIQEAHYFFHSLPERPKLRRLLENQNNESLLHKTHWRRFTTSRKVW